MDFQTILTLAGAAAAAFFGSKLLVKGDDRVEDRRRTAIDLAVWAKNNGLGITSELLSNYAVGAYAELVGNIRQIASVLRDPDEAKLVIQRFLRVQLDKQLDTVEGKEELVKYIEEKLGVVVDRKAITKEPVTLGKEASAVEEVAR